MPWDHEIILQYRPDPSSDLVLINSVVMEDDYNYPTPVLYHSKLCQQIKSKIGNVSKPSLCGHKKKEAQLLTRNYCCNWSSFYTALICYQFTEFYQMRWLVTAACFKSHRSIFIHTCSLKQATLTPKYFEYWREIRVAKPSVHSTSFINQNDLSEEYVSIHPWSLWASF